jgi:hypothetical protein
MVPSELRQGDATVVRLPQDPEFPYTPVPDPGTSRPNGEEPTLLGPRAHEQVVDATCPHCLGAPAGATCHVCKQERVVRWFSDLARACANIWAREGCACGACKAIGRAPGI